MDFWGDVLVSVLGSLGSLGVAFVIYRFTRNDEADRLERTFAAERKARLEDVARERRMSETGNAPQLLVHLTRTLANNRLAATKEDQDVPWDDVMDSIGQTIGLNTELNEQRLTMTRAEQMFLDAGQVIRLTAEFIGIAQAAADIRMRPMQSWLNDLGDFRLYLMNLALEYRDLLIEWEDTGIYAELEGPDIGRSQSPGMPAYPSLTRPEAPPESE